MKPGSDTWFADCVAMLADPPNQRVWSIIVSVFGDLARRPGDSLSGGALTRIIGPIGIRPEAMRVALHRLRKDGWLQSARTGRESRHFLTDYGRDQSAAVSPRIYTRSPDLPETWHLLVAGGGKGAAVLEQFMLADNYIGIAPNLALGEGPPPADCDGLLVFEARAESVPSWFRSSVVSEDLNAACADLLASLQQADGVMGTSPAATPLETATLRTLIVHRWRRVVLRHPDLPRHFYPETWTGPACRMAVFHLLDRLPKPDLAAIEACCAEA